MYDFKLLKPISSTLHVLGVVIAVISVLGGIGLMSSGLTVYSPEYVLLLEALPLEFSFSQQVISSICYCKSKKIRVSNNNSAP